MAILEIELQPEEQAWLQQEAESEGLLVRDWVRRRLTNAAPVSSIAKARLAIQEAKSEATEKPLWEIIAELDAIEVPAEERARIPHDGSINYKHYLYGAPKADVPGDLK